MELGKLVAQLSGAMLGVEDFHALLQEATEEIARATGAAFVSVHLDRSGERLEYRFDRGGRVPATFTPHLPLRVASTAGTRSHLLTAEGPNARVFADAGLRFALLVPVRMSKEEELVLCVGFGEPGHALATTEIEGIEALGTMLAVGASRHTFQQMAIFDPFTKLYNRRWLEAHLPTEVQRVQRFRQPLAVLALDVDNFKMINDEHGHPVGDRVLAAIARILLDSIRGTDYAIRIGGDEFLALFPGTGAAGAARISGRVLERVRALSFGDARTPLRVTVSGGVALASHESTVESLLRDADDALYEAKRGGRDSIRVPENTPHIAEHPAVANRRARA